MRLDLFEFLRMLPGEFQGESRVWENRTHGLVREVKGRRLGRTTFTLVELLVVIAIISILAGLLLPTLKKAWEQAKAIDCMNRQKNCGLALIGYSSDFNSYFMPPYASGYSGGERYWHQVLAVNSYMQCSDLGSEKGTGIFRCPSLAFKGGYSSEIYGMVSTYSNAASDYTFVKIVTLRNPSGRIYLADSAFYGGSAGFQQRYVVDGGLYLYNSTSNSTRVHTRHGNKFNAWFLDGHLKKTDPAKVARSYERNIYYFSNDGSGNIQSP